MFIFLINLILTLAVELTVGRILFKREKIPFSTRKMILANVISNPLAQIAHRVLFLNLWFIELLVVVLESFFYFSKEKPYREVFTLSLFLNLSSVLVGILIYSFKTIT